MRIFCVAICLMAFAAHAESAGEAKTSWISETELRDKIQGAWVGTLIGGLEGLPHEYKYLDEPAADLPDFNVSISDGPRTDDDNDFELTHLYYMDQRNVLKIAYQDIPAIWLTNMKEGVWCANARARDLMEEGAVPPATADPAANEFAVYNISGQFAVEMYGVISPGMPRAAADIGVHYAGIAVSGEPLQATRFWTAMTSLAPFHQGTLEELMTLALGFIDPSSAMAGAANDAIKFYKENPADWKAARQLFCKTWVSEDKWNKNSTPTNGGLIVLALLFGQDDFYRTLQYAMAMGLDADCNAATAGAVLGARHGYGKIKAIDGFNMSETFKNLVRPGLPERMTIPEQVDMFMRVSQRVITENGGKADEKDGVSGFQITRQE